MPEIPVADPHFDMFPAGQTAASWLTIPGGGTDCVFADNTTVGWEQSATRSQAPTRASTKPACRSTQLRSTATR